MTTRTVRTVLEGDARPLFATLDQAAAKLESTAGVMERASSGTVTFGDRMEQAGTATAGTAEQVRRASDEAVTFGDRMEWAGRQSAGTAEQTKKAGTEVGAFADVVERAGERSVDWGQRSTKSWQDFAETAIQNREHWTRTGTALVGVGAATTALGVATLKTGIEYNTLRQRSLAALTTLLGSAEAANAQMDRLDDFARNSPFARQVFIEAQQQLIGFGMAARDVVPTLSAIENAVAATGGSNAEIMELAEIIARVGAVGKWTARDLEMLGRRGVNAAEIIGEQMGYTGAQIREQITAGTLDADAAITALVEGMNTRFAGAAANVKETFDGATDRVRAAIRDISAAWASMLVDPQGGGWLVDFLNWIADLLRGFEALPGPIRNTMLSVGLLAGVVSLLAGSLLLAVPRMAQFHASSVALAATMPRVAATVGATTAVMRGMTTLMLGPWGIAIGAVVAGLGYFINKQGQAKAAADDFKATLDEQTGALTELTSAEAVSRLRGEQGGLIKLWEGMGGSIGDVTNAMLGNIDARDRVIASLERERDRAMAIRDDYENYSIQEQQEAQERIFRLSEYIVWLDKEHDAARRGMADKQEELRLRREADEALQGTSRSQRSLNAETERWTALARAAGVEVTGVITGMDDLEEATEEATQALEEQAHAWRQLVDGVAGSVSSHVSLTGAMKDYQDAVRTWAEETVEANEKSKKSVQDFVDEHEFSYTKYVKHLEAQAEAQREWATNMARLAAYVSEETLAELARMGPEEGGLIVKGALDSIENDAVSWVERMENAMRDGGIGSVRGMSEAMLSTQHVLAAVARKLGQDSADTIRDQIAAGELSVADVVRRYNLYTEVKVGADLSSFYGAVQSGMHWARGQRPVIGVGPRLALADGGPIYGAGGPRDDRVHVMASNGEHMWSTAETNAAGGHRGVAALRKAALTGRIQYMPTGALVHLADGGPADPRAARYMTAAPAPQVVQVQSQTGPTGPSGPVQIVGTLEMRGSQAHIMGVIREQATEAMLITESAKAQAGSGLVVWPG